MAIPSAAEEQLGISVASEVGGASEREREGMDLEGIEIVSSNPSDPTDVDVEQAASPVADSSPPSLSLEIDLPVADPIIQQSWDELVTYINEWYHDIDQQVLRIAIACAVAQNIRNEVPTWLFVLGPSATGKSLIPELIAPLPDVHRLNSITANTMLSGLPKSKGGQSLLLEIGRQGDRSGIFVFPDFSTVISRREDTVKAIAGDLREVYDGRLTKHTGSGRPLTWEGKLTIIAMCTPDLERYWGAMRGLGERFVQVRWNRGDGISQAKKAFTQIGKEQDIKKEIRRLSGAFLKHTSILFPKVLDPIKSGVAHLSEITALLRAGVSRDDHTKKLLEVSVPEGNTRFLKAIIQIARAHAAMFKREMVIEDYQLAARVALDSIPLRRLQIVQQIDTGIGGVTQQELIDLMKIPKISVLRNLEELEFLGVVDVDRNGSADNVVELSKKFRKMTQEAGKLWPLESN